MRAPVRPRGELNRATSPAAFDGNYSRLCTLPSTHVIWSRFGPKPRRELPAELIEPAFVGVDRRAVQSPPSGSLELEREGLDSPGELGELASLAALPNASRRSAEAATAFRGPCRRFP